MSIMAQQCQPYSPLPVKLNMMCTYTSKVPLCYTCSHTDFTQRLGEPYFTGRNHTPSCPPVQGFHWCEIRIDRRVFPADTTVIYYAEKRPRELTLCGETAMRTWGTVQTRGNVVYMSIDCW